MTKRLLFLNADAGAGSGGSSDPAAGAAITGDAPASSSTHGSILGGAPAAASTPSGSSPWALNEKGEFADGWLDALSEDFADSKQILGQFKDPASMAKTLINQQRLLGKKGDAVLVPGEKSTPEDIAAFRAKIGVPDSSDKYPTKIDGLPQGVSIDEAKIKEFNALAHKAGLTPTQAAEIVKFDAAREAARLQGEGAAEKAAFDAQSKAVADAWGANYDRNKALAERMAQSVGLPLDTREWTPDKVVIALERAARLISEDRIVGPDASPSFQVGKVKATDIMKNPDNPHHARWASGDPETIRLVTDLIKNG